MATNERRCWADYATWAEEHYGVEHWWQAPDEVFDRIMGDGDPDTPFDGFTCLLAEGHDGEHEWTPDGEVTVTFTSLQVPA